MKLVSVEKGFVYCLHDEVNGICRIGKTASKDGSRQKQQLSYLPFEVKITTVAVDNHTYIERFIHRAFAEYRTRGDWFSISVEMFHEQVELGKQSFYEDLSKTMNYHDKHNHNRFMIKDLPMSTNEKVYKCWHCEFTTIHSSLWTIHQVSCKDSGNYYDACIGCKHCERVDKEVIKPYKQKDKEPRIIKSNGFKCNKLELSMYPRAVIRRGYINSMPSGTFDGEVLMPSACEHYEDEILIKIKNHENR